MGEITDIRTLFNETDGSSHYIMTNGSVIVQISFLPVAYPDEGQHDDIMHDTMDVLEPRKSLYGSAEGGGDIHSIAYDPYTKSVYYSIPTEKLIFRKYLQNEKTKRSVDMEELLLPIGPLQNGQASNLDMDSYLSLLCWLQTSNHRNILCSDLNGENTHIKFTSMKKSEKIVSFAINSKQHEMFIIIVVS